MLSFMVFLKFCCREWKSCLIHWANKNWESPCWVCRYGLAKVVFSVVQIGISCKTISWTKGPGDPPPPPPPPPPLHFGKFAFNSTFTKKFIIIALKWILSAIDANQCIADCRNGQIWGDPKQCQTKESVSPPSQEQGLIRASRRAF